MQTVYIGSTLVNDVMLGSQRMDDVLQGRFIGTDQNVKNFVNATGITNTETISALDVFVTTLKNDGIWTKLYALYPFVGGTQNTNRVNLINTASYNLGFTGSWDYNDNGISGNGTNTYANTSFIPTSSVSDFNRNSSLAIYTRTDTTSSGYDIGAEDNQANRFYIICKNLGNKSSYSVSTEIALTSVSDQNGAGLFIGNVSGSSSNNQKIFRNGTSIANKTNTTPLPDTCRFPLYIGANNFKDTGVNSFVSESFSYASIGKGLTDSEASTYYTIVQDFQTTLGRQV
jgi:hypothetical protein